MAPLTETSESIPTRIGSMCCGALAITWVSVLRPHACVGMNLARIEMMALFTELAKRVRRFTIDEEKRILNNVLRGFKTLRVAVN